MRFVFFVLTLLSILHLNEATFLYDHDYQSCKLTKISVVEKKKRKVEVSQDFLFPNEVRNATYLNENVLLFNICGTMDKNVSSCSTDSVACIMNKKKRFINLGTTFFFENTTDHRLSTKNGENCTASQNYSLTINLHCPTHLEDNSPTVRKTTDCQYEMTIPDPNCPIPCAVNVDGKFVDLTPLKKSFCIMEDSNETSFCVSLCETNLNCVQNYGKSNSMFLINKTDLNACELSSKDIKPISLGSTLKAFYEQDKLVFKGTLHEIGKTKIINKLTVTLKCNWEKKTSEDTDLKYIKKATQGRFYDFELETAYGCIKKPASCLIEEDFLLYNLSGLYTSHKGGWTVKNISNNMVLSICGPLNLPLEYRNCLATYSQICEMVEGESINRGSILRNLQIKDDVILAKIENGSQCKEDPHTQYATFIKFHCDKNEEGPYFVKQDKCNTYILWKTPYACPSFNKSHCSQSAPMSYNSCRFSQNDTRYDLTSLGHQKVINDTTELYVSLCQSVTVEDAPCLTDSSIVLLNGTQFNKKYRAISLGKFTEVLRDNDKLIMRYTEGHYCAEGQDYSSSITLQCSEVEEGPLLVSQNKCFFEFYWKSRSACNIPIPSNNCDFTHVENNLSYDFTHIKKQVLIKDVNHSYIFDICQDNYTVCYHGVCLTKLLQTKRNLIVTAENKTVVQMLLTKRCNAAENFNVVNFDLVCDNIKHNEHAQSYARNGCVLDIKYATNVVCSNQESGSIVPCNPGIDGQDVCDKSHAVMPSKNSVALSDASKIALGVSGGILILIILSVLCYMFLRKRVQYKSISATHIYVKRPEVREVF